MTIIELVTNLYFLYTIIWILLGLWMIERTNINKTYDRVGLVLFSPIVFIFVVLSKILNVNEKE